MKLNYFRCGDYLFPDMGLSGKLMEHLPAQPMSPVFLADKNAGNPWIDIRKRIVVRFRNGHHANDPIAVQHNKGRFPVCQAPLVDHPQQMFFCLFPGEKRDIILNSASFVPCSTLRIG